MVITGWARYYISLVIFLLAIVALCVSKMYFEIDIGNWYWLIFGGLFLYLWKASPPYKNYTFKMVTVFEMNEPILVTGRFCSAYEVRPKSIDQELGLELSFVKITFDGTASQERKSIGSIRLKPSDMSAILHKYSGRLDIIYAYNDELHSTRYLEKIPPGAIGLILHFAGRGDRGIFATLETVRKTPTSWDMMKGY